MGWEEAPPRVPMFTGDLPRSDHPLPKAVRDARDQELTWAQIGELLNTTAATAARRYRGKP
jgi:hypothetical protein